jgi:hypothetical protein
MVTVMVMYSHLRGRRLVYLSTPANFLPARCPCRAIPSPQDTASPTFRQVMIPEGRPLMSMKVISTLEHAMTVILRAGATKTL